MPRQLIDPESGDKRFDARVHRRDHKGKLVEVRPYTLIARDGVQIFRDEKGSYYADGSDVPQKVLEQMELVQPKKAASAPKPSTEKTKQVAPDETTQEPQAPSVDEDDQDVDPEPHASGSTGTAGL